MDYFENEPLASKLVLEVGSGRGDTTRKLVDLLSGEPGAQLIAADDSDVFFPHLQEEFRYKDVAVQFIRTRAQELLGVRDGSVDHLVCNYTLFAVNAQVGQAALALQRFWQVLKAGGKLWLEEEFPVGSEETPAQSVWAGKWRILKAAQVLTGRLPYQEMAPQTLENLCRMAGFAATQWTADTQIYPPQALDFFQKRLDALLPELPNENLRLGFNKMARELFQKAVRAGGMEVPYYRFNAQKRS